MAIKDTSCTYSVFHWFQADYVWTATVLTKLGGGKGGGGGFLFLTQSIHCFFREIIL